MHQTFFQTVQTKVIIMVRIANIYWALTMCQALCDLIYMCGLIESSKAMFVLAIISTSQMRKPRTEKINLSKVIHLVYVRAKV